MIMTLFDTLVINKVSREDENFDTAIEDMFGYISRMGGSIEEESNCWRINCPYLWTSSIYKRFKSFGIRPLFPLETQWLAHTLIDDDIIEPITFKVAGRNG